MKKFISEDKFHIKGRGDVYTLKVQEDIQVEDIFNKEIEVDGTTYICRGIERFGTRLGDPIICKGEAVGLLVESL